MASKHTLSREEQPQRWPLPPRRRPDLADFSRASLIAYLQTAPLDEVDISDPMYWETDTNSIYFKRLRDEAPVHFTTHNSDRHRGFWSVTRWADIMAVDTNHNVYSSDAHLGGITLFDMDQDFIMPMFIAMDPPKHDVQRKAVNPIVSGPNLASFEGLIRERTREVLDGLPRGEAFDWVDRVSIELTSRMLATLFDFPQEHRRKLTYWSDVSTSDAEIPGNPQKEERQAILMGMLQEFTLLWNQRVNEPPKGDLVSMLAHNPATRDMPPMEFMGNLVLLIVGGNDTTRNSTTGGVYEFSKNPGEWAKLRANPALVESAVSEIIRYQTPLAHMRRTALEDTILGGQRIRKGDKVVMWYSSGNRDERAIENPDAFIIDRPRARQHMSFGFGIHRCVGNRLAELQLKILWEEILARFESIEVLEEPERVPSAFVKGYKSMMVRLPA
ncbi:cytochrome P450 [Polymorphobacter glacialis]|uniref:Cytochrome P450 n=1 Tax=Sandarakinorhabdus glacialis TaxID=1614636 RepID=A0A916ZJX7_9SPHN|nr:cytochrome P450 [Polymorphobacter glacialis]GGE00847.1 cytochrome P450 [Polymorphobacter glacialis]